MMERRKSGLVPEKSEWEIVRPESPAFDKEAPFIWLLGGNKEGFCGQPGVE